jgi:nucleotide-binding universal stress UspA family protein
MGLAHVFVEAAMRPSVLCPIDFSSPSRAALRYASAIAERFRTSLTLLAVNDPLLAEASEMRAGPDWLPQDSERELRRFFEQTFEHRTLFPIDVQIVVTTGRPAQEILRIGRERHSDLIVMSTHGLTGVRKLFFGATTERVLRETDIPVLVTPPVEPGPLYFDDVRQLVGRILAPVDLTAASENQVQIAGALAWAVDVPLLLAHVVEPVRFPGPPTLLRPTVDGHRRSRSEQALQELTATVHKGVRSEALTAFGDPADEIAKIAKERHVGLIVIGLHASPLAGPRMGSVTYRVLCQSQTPVLALPPVLPASVRWVAVPMTESAIVSVVRTAI